MDNQEAICRIREHMKIHGTEGGRAVRINEALDMAIKALADLSPSTVTAFETPVERYHDVVRFDGSCPICFCYLKRSWKACPMCAERIKWDDSN